MAGLLWDWKPMFAVAPWLVACCAVARGHLIVTSHTNCDVTSCLVVMGRYSNADGDEQRHKTSKTQVFRGFFIYKMVITVEYELITCRGRAGVVVTVIRHSTSYAGRRAAAWSIPIIGTGSNICLERCWEGILKNMSEFGSIKTTLNTRNCI